MTTRNDGFLSIKAALKESSKSVKYLSLQSLDGPLRLLSSRSDVARSPSSSSSSSSSYSNTFSKSSVGLQSATSRVDSDSFNLIPPDALAVPSRPTSARPAGAGAASSVSLRTSNQSDDLSQKQSPLKAERTNLRDPAAVSIAVASKSTARVNLALTRIGIEPPMPSLDFAGNITVYPPRYPAILEESERMINPLGEFSSKTKRTSTPGATIPKLKRSIVYDVGDMGRSVVVKMASQVERDPAKVVLDARGHPITPTATSIVTDEERSRALRRLQQARADLTGKPVATAPAPISANAPAHQGGDGEGHPSSHQLHDRPSIADHPSTKLPPRLSERTFTAARLPPTMTYAVASLSNNSIFKIAPKAPQDPSALIENKTEDENDDGTKIDPQAVITAQRVAYASVGLLPPPAFKSKEGTFSGIAEIQLDAAKKAAVMLDPVHTKRMGVEMNLLEKRVEKTSVHEALGSSLVGAKAGGSWKRPVRSAQSTGSPSSPSSNNDEDNESVSSSNRAAAYAEERVRKEEEARKRLLNPFNLNQEQLSRISKNPSNVIVDLSGNIRVGSLQLEPGQVASMSAMQQSDPKAASAFGAMLMHTSAERDKILKAKSDFDKISSQASVDAKAGISSYLYRLNLRRPHRSTAVEDVVWMRGANTSRRPQTSSSASTGQLIGILHSSEGNSNEARAEEKERGTVKFKESTEEDSARTSEAVERAMAEVQEQKELEEEDSGVSGNTSKLNVTNTADSRGALSAMRLVTEREALLDEVDSLSIVMEALPLISINRPAGLSGIERSLLHLLRQATTSGVTIDKAFMFRMLSLLHDSVLSLPSTELHLPESLAALIKRGEDHSQLGPNAFDDPSILAFGVGGARESSAKRHAEVMSQKRLFELKDLEEQSFQEMIKEEREAAAAIIQERKRKVTEDKEKKERAMREEEDRFALRKYDAFTSRAGKTTTRPQSAMPILNATNSSLSSSGIASSTVRPRPSTARIDGFGSQENNSVAGDTKTIMMSTSRPSTASSSYLRPASGATVRSTMRPTSAITATSSSSTQKRRSPSPPAKKPSGEELEPLHSMPAQLLSNAELAAKAVRRSWPTTLFRPLALLLTAVGISEGEFALWLSERGLEVPTEERAAEIDQRARERAQREHDEGLM